MNKTLIFMFLLGLFFHLGIGLAVYFIWGFIGVYFHIFSPNLISCLLLAFLVFIGGIKIERE